MAAAVNHRLFFCQSNTRTFAGFLTSRLPGNLPLRFSSFSTSLFCSSSSSSNPQLRGQASYHVLTRSLTFVNQITPLLGPSPGSQTVGSEIEEKKDDIFEQLGIQRLGNKEKKELRAYAHGLGTRLNVQQVGKLGVSETVVKSISDALEANEILKVRVLENCGSDMSEIVVQLERGTRGQVVGKIGRTVLLYRASQKKLAASEKKTPEKTRPRRK